MSQIRERQPVSGRIGWRLLCAVPTGQHGRVSDVLVPSTAHLLALRRRLGTIESRAQSHLVNVARQWPVLRRLAPGRICLARYSRYRYLLFGRPERWFPAGVYFTARFFLAHCGAISPIAVKLSHMIESVGTQTM